METVSVTLALWGSLALGHASCLARSGFHLAGHGPWPCQSPPIVISKLGRTEMRWSWGGVGYPSALGVWVTGRAPLPAGTRLEGWSGVLAPGLGLAAV